MQSFNFAVLFISLSLAFFPSLLASPSSSRQFDPTAHLTVGHSLYPSPSSVSYSNLYTPQSEFSSGISSTSNPQLSFSAKDTPSFPAVIHTINTTNIIGYIRDDPSDPPLSPTPPSRVMALHRWTIDLDIDGTIFPVVMDPGSSFLVLFNQSICDNWIINPDPLLFNGSAFHPMCFNGNAYSPRSSFASYNLKIDSGIRISLFDLRSYRLNMAIKPRSTFLSPITNVPLISANQESTWLSRYFWNNTNGIIGLRYDFSTALDTINTFYQVMLELPQYQRWIGIHVNSSLWSPGIPSTQANLHLGGILSTMTESFSWSDPVRVHIVSPGVFGPVNRPYEATLYSLDICDHSLFVNHTQFIRASIDWSAQCLNLPGEMFDSLMQWIPVDCYDDSYDSNNAYEKEKSLNRGNVLRSVCYLKTGVNPSQLPSLLFTIRQPNKPGDSPIQYQIPLSTLLFDDQSVISGGNLRLCIERQGYIINTYHLIQNQDDVSLSPNPSIIFGAMTLQSLYTVLDIESSMVGFANLFSSQSDNTLCTPEVKCQGQQLYYVGSNSCESPLCLYWLTSWNPEFYRCELSPFFYVPLISILVLFVIVQFVLVRYHIFLSRKPMSFIPAAWIGSDDHKYAKFVVDHAHQ